MQNYITTNIQMPREIWKAVKIRAAEEGCTMKDLILRGVQQVLGIKAARKKRRDNAVEVMLEMAGSWKDIRLPRDISANHDEYIYGKLDKK